MTKKNVLLKKFSLESLRSQFLEIIDLLNARGVNYYLVGGALLGIVRSGDLLPWDRDTDLFVKYEDLNEHKLFMHWKYLTLLKAIDEPWMDWVKQYKDVMI